MSNPPSNNINYDFKGKDIVSLDQFSQKDLKIVFSHTEKMKDLAKNAKPSKILGGNIVILLFYEPSSRTFGSFSAAVKKLGGQTVEITDPKHFSSVAKGETLKDTIRVFEGYCDAIVLRHPKAGTATKAASIANFVPIINAGDGVGEHPTQAILDLYTIYERFKRLDNLTGIMAGDMLNGRTAHSLIRGLALYPKNVLYLLSPKSLRLSRNDYSNFSKRGIKLIEIESEEDMPKNAHFWYWTRVQKERFRKKSDYEQTKNRFVVSQKLIQKRAGKYTIIMHPLPRVGEIETGVDKDERALYLTSQIRNGLYVRMALLALVLGKV